VHHIDDSQVEFARELGYYKVCLMDYRPEVLEERMRKHPDFIVGLGWLPLDQEIPVALKALEAFRAIGCTGFKVCCAGAPYDDERFYPVWEKAQAYHMPVFFHTGWLDQRLATATYPTKKRLLVHWYDVMTLDRVALDFPEMRITAFHMGVTRPADAGVLMRNHRNVFGDTCTNLDENFWGAIGGKGPGYAVLAKMVIGTDGMGTREAHRAKMAHTQEFLEMVGASPALQERVFYKTALRVLGMDEELKKAVHVRKAHAADMDVEKALAGQAAGRHLADFVDRQGEPAKAATLAYLGYDDKALHMTFICRDENVDKLAISRTGPVGEIWQDDSIEVFLSPTKDENYYHIVANSIGRAFYHFRRGEDATELPTPVKHKIADGRWAIQLSIPFAVLDAAPKSGDKWGLNMCRNKISPPGETISWMEIASTFHDPASFGYLVFE
jgi:predicted TIM-barrel fold metal-dependent hydrolase